jgi:DNA primase catalytic core
MSSNASGGRIRESSIEALRERINLIEVVSTSVSLKRSGSRYMGKCPFHADSSPSFLVDDKHYHCFGCQAHGDAIAFEMNRTGCTFPEAIETLARRFNFSLDYESDSNESESDRKAREQKKTLVHVMAEVGRAYAQYLWSAEGKDARDYLKKRGFSDEHLKEWDVGLAPNASVLKRMAEVRGWETSILFSAGLIRQRENSNESFDFFRDRIMIPIRDDKGQCVAFGGRIYRDAPAGRNLGPKYLNSPETLLFQKSKTLFNYHRARNAIVQAGSVIVVEGYMDCLALARAGVQNVVAVLGTALTAEHVKKLARLTKRVVLCFDSDNAGRDAARKAFEVGFPLNLVELQFVSVPSGKDPDDYIRENGVVAFESLLSKAIPLSNWLCDFLLSQCNTREAQLRRIKSDFVPVVMKNPDPAVREITLDVATNALGLSNSNVLTSGFRSSHSSKIGPQSASSVASEREESPKLVVDSTSHLDNRRVEDASASIQLAFSSTEEAIFFLTLAHAQFELLPDRLKNVLKGEQSQDPMDEIVLAQMLAAESHGALCRGILELGECLLQADADVALVEMNAERVLTHSGLLRWRALASLDPERLLEAGLEHWVRGVLEPNETQGLAPKLRNLENLFDSANLAFVRMVVRDAKVSRARSKLTSMLSRMLSNIEISYLDSAIEKTTRDLRHTEKLPIPEQDEVAALQARLRKLSAERVRRYRKFISRTNL